MGVNKVFKTSTGLVLHLRPVSLDLIKKCGQIAAANMEKPHDEAEPIFLAMLAELFEQGITKFELTEEQAALVTLTRPTLKKVIPGLKNNVSDFTLFIFSQVRLSEDLVALSQAIFKVTENSKTYRAAAGRPGLLAGLFPVKG